MTMFIIMFINDDGTEKEKKTLPLLGIPFNNIKDTVVLIHIIWCSRICNI